MITQLTSLFSPKSTQIKDQQPANILICQDRDNAIRWQPGERLHHLFEQRVDQLKAEDHLSHPAVDTPEGQWTYRQLDDRANQLARYLQLQGLGSGDRIGLLFDKGIHGYAAMLAVLKIQGAYVPLDPAFPGDRIAYIAADAGLKSIATLSCYGSLIEDAGVDVLCLDSLAAEIDQCDGRRLSPAETDPPLDELCYIIYTSGTTGRPKGVPIDQASICNFVRVAAEVYGYHSNDRVYQGLTMAFDFAVEEIWVPLIVGATLVPNQTGSSLLGRDLTDFLIKSRITAMCCVPTLLATLDQDLPELRLLIVSGEACPQDLIRRWSSPRRTLLNAYGPTETTVTATLARPQPDEQITIGKPLPTYSLLILEPGSNRVLPFGEEGEIAIAGVGVARGYLNRERETEKAFINDFLELENNPSGLIYRTGDLGLINENREIEYRGRIDLQVKIRGYRIELTEIESVILTIPQVAQVVVDTFEPLPGTKELVAYYTLHDDEDNRLTPEELADTLRMLLPDYMVPAYYENLEVIPMLASDKADRKALPKPSGNRLNTGSRTFVQPKTPLETDIAQVLAELLQLDEVSTADHFFDDLGANSLLMAYFCTKLRERAPEIDVSMRDVYVHPTVAELADHLASQAGDPEDRQQKIRVDEFRLPRRREYYLCGASQLLAYLLFFGLSMGYLRVAFDWVFSAPGFAGLYLRFAAFLAGTFFGGTAVAIGAKWILAGKWRPEKFPIWGIQYFRLWLLKRIFFLSPMAMMKGLPLYNLYLRLLGAKIGRNVVIECRVPPICTDLFTIGDNTILRKDSVIVSYKARSNYIYTGPVTLGRNVVVGEGSVIDINTEMKDYAQLGHASCLREGQVIAENRRCHGNPAVETAADFRFGDDKQLTRRRVVLFSLVQLLNAFFGLLPLAMAWGYTLQGRLITGQHQLLSMAWAGQVLGRAFLVFCGLFCVGLFMSTVVPRLLQRFLKADQSYVRYGFHFLIFKIIQRLSNSKFFIPMFGDSSYIIQYMKLVGYRFAKIIQTGSNFGLDHRHDNPFLCCFGSGTMISDGFYMLNSEESGTSFCLKQNALGDENFVGNRVYYPVSGKTGNNCLIATKAMVPVDGEIRENVGVLGSPGFKIPRSVDRDQRFERVTRSADRLRGLARKNKYNLRTIALYLFTWFIYLYLVLLTDSAMIRMSPTFGLFGWIVADGLFVLFSIAYFIFRERAAVGFDPMRPLIVSIYDREYWRVERLWKHSEMFLRLLWAGTPFRFVINRLLGIKQGKMVFDDGFAASEKTLVTIGDYCNINEHSVLQAHSLEDGVYKSDTITVGNRCTLEPGAFVHYGVTVDDGVTILIDSFVMKGEHPVTGTVWGGNPAQVIRAGKDSQAPRENLPPLAGIS